jgi:hypothetical protein
MKKSVLALIAIFALAGFDRDGRSMHNAVLGRRWRRTLARCRRLGGGGGGSWSGGGGGSHMMGNWSGSRGGSWNGVTGDSGGSLERWWLAQRRWLARRLAWRLRLAWLLGLRVGGAWWGPSQRRGGAGYGGVPRLRMGLGLSGSTPTATHRNRPSTTNNRSRLPAYAPAPPGGVSWFLPATRRLLSVRAKLHEAVGACRPQRDATATLPAARLNATQGDVT